MAECLGEFDAPSPMPTRFCSRISLKEYEENSSKNTEAGLQELVKYLQYNPTVYYEIIAKRKQDEIDNAGFFSYLKSRLAEWYTGSSETVNPVEARRQLEELKDNIAKSFNYSQEAKGSTRRFSSRIAERKWRKVNKIPLPKTEVDEAFNDGCTAEKKPKYTSVKSKESFPIPPVTGSSKVPPLRIGAPPPPPPPLSSVPPPPPPPPLLEPSSSTSYSLRQKIASQKKKLKKVTSRNDKREEKGGGIVNMMNQIKNPKTRDALKQISENKRTCGNWTTPPRKQYSASADDYSNMFNMELLRKFQNAKSPLGGDSPSFNDVTFTP